jgi:hypothetical protein
MKFIAELAKLKAGFILDVSPETFTRYPALILFIELQYTALSGYSASELIEYDVRRTSHGIFKEVLQIPRELSN